MFKDFYEVQHLQYYKNFITKNAIRHPGRVNFFMW